LLQEIILVHRKDALVFRNILKINLFDTRVRKGPLLPALNLLFATEDLGRAATLSVGASSYYALTARDITAVCVAEPTDSQDDIEVLLRDILQLLEEKDVKTIENETDSLAETIRGLAREIVPSEMARDVVKDLRALEEAEERIAKILFLGLSQAGKTSVYKMFFENAQQEDIIKLQPTILRDIHAPEVKVAAKEQVSVVDLGGQTQYLPIHLQDQDTFADVRALIFVIDLQDTERFEEAAQFFSQVIEIIQEQGQKPSVTVLLHKYDPMLKDWILANLPDVVRTVGKVLRPLNPVYFFTSVFDRNSIDQALINVLFRALPLDVLEQTLAQDVLVDAFERIIPVYEQLSNRGDLNEDEILGMLKDQSMEIGCVLAKRMANRWYQFLCEGVAYEVSAEEAIVRVDHLDVVRFEINCPIPEEKREISFCWITHGLLEGVAKILGLGSIDRIRTTIIDNSPSCVFVAKYE
jgi:hypothetical protein